MVQEYKVKIDQFGTMSWYQNDKRHRLDGPAAEYANGGKLWYIDGVSMTEREWRSVIAARIEDAGDEPDIASASRAEWAERALRAEAKVRELALQELASLGQASEAYQAQLAAEEKLAKALDAFDAIKLYSTDGDARRKATETIAELKGQGDD